MANDLRSAWATTATYDIHKRLINQYLLNHPGDTSKLKRDTSRDKTDYDVIRENHKFLWNDTDTPTSWEAKLAKKYYDKLFKEYCICDLSHYKDNMVAMRWRTEKEVVSGKGQFSCGNKNCSETESLKTWEVNFAYTENNEKKNALVKIRLCENCSLKLNYRKRHREVTKDFKREEKHSNKRSISPNSGSDALQKKIKSENTKEKEKSSSNAVSSNVASASTNRQKCNAKQSRKDDFHDYLDHLLL